MTEAVNDKNQVEEGTFYFRTYTQICDNVTGHSSRG